MSAPSAVVSDGTNLWLANGGNAFDGHNVGSVTEFRAADGSWVRTVSGGAFGQSTPTAVTIADGRVWIANTAVSNLVELPPG